MAKRQRSVSLSFVLFRFAIIMLGCMLLCCIVGLFTTTLLQNTSVIYPGYTANQQVEQMLSGKPKTFVSPSDDFLPEYALFDRNGKVLESNVKFKKLENMVGFLQENTYDTRISRYTYENGSTVIIYWHYRKEFVNPVLRGILPPFEYFWWGTLGVAWVLCLLFNTLWLRRRLAGKLKLFSEVSEKVGAQELDFAIPHAGIREYEQALSAMNDMRKALYNSLSSQWAAQQEREAEIAALAHDLKTPLTLIGGNAELLLDEELSKGNRKMVETIMASNNRAKQYVTSLLETSVGVDEAFESTSLSTMFDELCQNTIAIAESKRVCLQTQNGLQGVANLKKAHLLRALGNVVQNAIEHTPSGRNVYLEGSMIDGGWQVIVQDEGSGFSKAALHHAKQRLWRDDISRKADGHNGFGLWFAEQVIKAHTGKLELSNYDSGGMVTVKFCQAVRNDS
jgi:signal transduction histidine kinase